MRTSEPMIEVQPEFNAVRLVGDVKAVFVNHRFASQCSRGAHFGSVFGTPAEQQAEHEDDQHCREHRGASSGSHRPSPPLDAPAEGLDGAPRSSLASCGEVPWVPRRAANSRAIRITPVTSHKRATTTSVHIRSGMD